MSNEQTNSEFDEAAYQQYIQQFYTDSSVQQGYQQQQYYQFQQERTAQGNSTKKETPSQQPPPPPPSQPPPPPPPEYPPQQGYYDQGGEGGAFYDPSQQGSGYYDPSQQGGGYYGQPQHYQGGYNNQGGNNPYQGGGGQGYHQGGYSRGGYHQGGHYGNRHGNNHYGGGHQQRGFGGGHHMQKNFKPPEPQPNINNSRTLYVGNLPPDTSDGELRTLAQPFGEIEDLKIVWPKSCAFIKMSEVSAATLAYQSLDQFNLRGRTLKLGWGKDTDFGANAPRENTPHSRPPMRPPRHEPQNPPNRILWLGNITPNVQEQDISTVFSAYGEVEHVKILRERSCAFVTFKDQEAAVQAKDALQGDTCLGTLPLKINFGKQNPQNQGGHGDEGDHGRTRNFREPPSMGYNMGGNNNNNNNNMGSRHLPVSTLIEQAARPRQPRLGPMANFAGHLPFPPCPTEPDILSDDPATRQVVVKTADYVARNGYSFEAKIRETQGHTEKMAFLKDDHPHNELYRFTLWCKRNPNLDPATEYERHKEEAELWRTELLNPPDPSQPNTQLDPNNSASGDIVAKLKEKLASGQKSDTLAPASELIEMVKGRLASTEDQEELQKILQDLNPKREVIKSTKNWIKDRPHLAKDLTTQILSLISQSTADAEIRMAYIYLIHDLLTSQVRTREKKSEMDVFAESLLPRIGQILFHAFRKQSSENQEQIREVLKVWEDKMVYSSEVLDNIETEMGVSLPPMEKKKSSKYDSDTRPKKSGRYEK